MTADPPSLDGAVHDSATCAESSVAARLPGAPGVVRGVAVVESEALPVPAALIAETRNVVAVPFERPSTTADVEVEPVSAMAVLQVVPPFVEDSTL